jgi:hypothetical protein
VMRTFSGPRRRAGPSPSSGGPPSRGRGQHVGGRGPEVVRVPSAVTSFSRAASVQETEGLGRAAPHPDRAHLDVRDVDGDARPPPDLHRLGQRAASSRRPRSGCGWRRTRRAGPRPPPGPPARRWWSNSRGRTPAPRTGRRRPPAMPRATSSRMAAISSGRAGRLKSRPSPSRGRCRARPWSPH